MNIEETKKQIEGSLNAGIVLGLKRSKTALNDFLNKKVNLKYPEYISRQELNTFLETYIELVEKELTKE